MSQPAPVAMAYENFSDTHLATRVRNFLLSKVMPGRGQLDVAADGGVVTLRGRVGSFYHKQLWIHGAQRVAGVHRVVDELDVTPAPAAF
jgi:osmotically-inducible protein OsmY